VAALIAMLTDFGDSHYAGVMKGVIHRICPGATVVDLSHQVTPHQVREGAWVLGTSFSFFPPGTVFLGVVDPGVGTPRQALAIRTRNYFFVGPDNGLLFPAVESDSPVVAVRLEVPRGASPTFHGRDVFAPAAARLARGDEVVEMGSPTEIKVRLHFHLEGREGEVVAIDRFGNVITNLPPVPGQRVYQLTLEGAATPGAGRTPLEVMLYTTYGDAPVGEPFLVVGSAGTLEISMREAAVAGRLGLRPGRWLRLQ